MRMHEQQRALARAANTQNTDASIGVKSTASLHPASIALRFIAAGRLCFVGRYTPCTPQSLTVENLNEEIRHVIPICDSGHYVSQRFDQPPNSCYWHQFQFSSSGFSKWLARTSPDLWTSHLFYQSLCIQVL